MLEYWPYAAAILFAIVVFVRWIDVKIWWIDLKLLWLSRCDDDESMENIDDHYPTDGRLIQQLQRHGVNSPDQVSFFKTLLTFEKRLSKEGGSSAEFIWDIPEYRLAENYMRLPEWVDIAVHATEKLFPDTRGVHHFTAEVITPPDEVERLLKRLLDNDRYKLFPHTAMQFQKNYEACGALLPSAYAEAYGPDGVAEVNFKDTPFIRFTSATQSVSLTERTRHTYILGGSGSGKTALIENIIAGDLRSDEDCCVVVIDSQTQLIDKLRRLDLPNVTCITPEWQLSLNLFDIGYEELRDQGIEGETLINKTVGLISFAMQGMMGKEFTTFQKTIFQYGVLLTVSIPGGNILTFMDILSEDGHLQYTDQIDKFDAVVQRFFYKDFGSNDYKVSREAIRRRLDAMLLNPTFRRLFLGTKNNFDMAEELATKQLILIDTNKPLLDDDASSFFGRLFIAMIVRAAHLRFTNRSGKKRRAYIIVDEAQEYFDKSITDILEQARKAEMGLILAHQSISQAKGEGTSNIADPLLVNTATKIISTGFRKDAAEFAANMGVSADDILALPQYTFGLYSRDQGFLPVRGKPDAFAGFPRRPDLGEFRKEMEQKYGPTPDEEPMHSGETTPSEPGKMQPPPPNPNLPDEPEMI